MFDFGDRLQGKMLCLIPPESALGIGYLLSGDEYGKPLSRLRLGEKLLIEPIHERFVRKTPFISVENDQHGLSQPAQILA